ncbi:MAG TPA: hypothetical protein VIL36_23280 [Acidimicrobiales bacterium]
MKAIERPRYDPGPCPECRGRDVDVDWLHLLDIRGDLDEWLPGWLTCLNPSCGHVWSSRTAAADYEREPDSPAGAGRPWWRRALGRLRPRRAKA